jgi:DinB superfamily
MTALTFDDLETLRSPLNTGETDIETVSSNYSVEDLTDTVRVTRGLLQAIADGWTQDQLLARPSMHDREDVALSEDRWSATEAISHLIATQNWYLLHMGRLLGRREHFDVMPHGLGDLAHQDILKADLEEQLRSATTRFLEYIASIPADADFTEKRSSTFFGDLSLKGWILLAALHDAEHRKQIQRIASTTFS